MTDCMLLLAAEVVGLLFTLAKGVMPTSMFSLRCSSSARLPSSWACQSASAFSRSLIWRRASALKRFFQSSSCSSCAASSLARSCAQTKFYTLLSLLHRQ